MTLIENSQEYKSIIMIMGCSAFANGQDASSSFLTRRKKTIPTILGRLNDLLCIFEIV